MTEQATPILTVEQVQDQRNQLAGQLVAAKAEHERLAYLAATSSAYDAEHHAARQAVDRIEGALRQLAVIEAGARAAEDASWQLAAEQWKEQQIEEADDSAGLALAAADRVDQAIAELTAAWRALDAEWVRHGDAVDSLVAGDNVKLSVQLATGRRGQMLRAVAELLGRGGMEVPEVRLSQETGRQPMVAVVEGFLTNVRRAARQSTDFPGAGKYAPRQAAGIEGDAESGFRIGGKNNEPSYWGGLTAEMAAAAGGPKPVALERRVSSMVTPSSPFGSRYAEID